MHHAYLGGLLEHTLAVSQLAVMLAGYYPTLNRDLLLTGALLHDIGKITLPSDYLAKPSKLTKEETAIVRCHSAVGYEILKHIHFPWPVAEIV